MSTDKVSGDSRFDAGLREWAKHMMRIATIQGLHPAHGIEPELRRRLLPLLEKTEILLNTDELDPVAWAAAKAALRKEWNTWRK